MVSTRRSGSLSNNKGKRSSSSEERLPSPKRQKVDNGTTSEKSTAADNSKKLGSPPAVDPQECAAGDPATGGGEAVSGVKADVAPEVSVATPVAEGIPPVVGDKSKNWFTSWKQKQDKNLNMPWCKLLTQNQLNPTMTVFTTNFLVGSGKNANLLIKDQTISGILCAIKLIQRGSNVVTVLESKNGKGSVQVNGKSIKKSDSCDLRSGDELVFGMLGGHAYIFQQLFDIVLKTPSLGTNFNMVHAERRAGDPSAVAGASILASLSSLRQDISRLKSTAQNISRTYHTAELPPSPIVSDDEPDALEVNSATNVDSDSAADIGETSKILPSDCNMDAGTEAGNIEEERDSIWDSLPYSSGTSTRYAIFREDVHKGIIDGRDIQVSFDTFPYYLSETTKDVLIAASYIQLKHRDQVRYTAELPTINPRILLSGPAGSEIYQEMLVKALANYYGAKFLIFDSHSILGGLSAKEAELQKEGNGVENIFKQNVGASVVAHGTGNSSVEVGTAISSNVPSAEGLGSQAKMEIETLLSSAVTSKNPVFKFGDRVRFIGSVSNNLFSTPSPSRRGPINKIHSRRRT